RRADRALARARTLAPRRPAPPRPALRRPRARSRARPRLDDRADARVVVGGSRRAAPGGRRVAALRAVLFDVGFTLARPGPELGPEGYRHAGVRHGLTLDPALYEQARDAALVDLKKHPELEHDDEIWFAFTERIVVGMGGARPGSYDCAVEITRGWE